MLCELYVCMCNWAHCVCTHWPAYWPGHSHRCMSITAGSRKDSLSRLATSKPAPISPTWPSSSCRIITPLYFHLLVRMSEWEREREREWERVSEREWGGGREGGKRRRECITCNLSITSVFSCSTEELIKFRFKPTPQWKQKFAEYIATVPSYYAQVSFLHTCMCVATAITHTYTL